MSEYRAEEPREARPVIKRRKRKKKRYLLKLVIFLLICGGGYAALHSGLFTIQQIQVSGNTYWSAARIEKTAGIRIGMNMFDFHRGTAERKLTEDPHIKTADITRGLPDLIVIRITERREAAAVPDGKAFVVLDPEGTVLAVRDRAPALPLLTGMQVTAANPKETVRVKESMALNRALALAAQMRKSGLSFKKINASGTIAVLSVTDTLLCKGRPADLMANMENGNLQNVLYHLAQQGTKKGVINIDANQYCSFTPKIK